MLATAIEQLIKSCVSKTLARRSGPDGGDVPNLPSRLVATDNFGEVVEKLVILHIRMWMLEDQLGLAETDGEIAALKRKTDICFKQRRPRLVEAINALVDDAIITGKSLREDSVKSYAGEVRDPAK